MAFDGSSRELNIRVVVDANGAVTALRNVGDRIRHTGEEASKAGTPIARLRDETKKTGEEVRRAVSPVEGFNTSLDALKRAALPATIALGSLAAAFSGVKKLADIGDQVNNATEALDNFARKAGTTARAVTAELAAAYSGTVDNLTLMQQANRALAAGLPIQALDEVAQAARAYGDSIGISATEANQRFIQALSRGSEQQLRQLGLFKDGKITLDAYNASMLTQIQSQGGVTDAIGRATTAFQNLIQDLGRAVENSEALRLAMSALLEIALRVTQGIADTAKVIIRLLDIMVERVYLAVDGFYVLAEVAAQISRAELPSLSKAMDAVAKTKLEKALEEKREALEELNERTTEAETALQKFFESIKEGKEELTDAQKAAKAMAKELASIPAVVRRRQDFAGFLKQYRIEFADAVKAGVNQATQEFYNFKVNAIAELTQIVGSAETAAATVDQLLAEAAKEQADALDEAREKAEELEKSIDSVGTAIVGAFSGNASTVKSFGNILDQAIDMAFDALIDSMLQDGNENQKRNAQLGAGLGTLVGGALGAYFSSGNPYATAAAAQAGGMIGQFLGSLFGKDSAGTKARKEVDRLFADLFNANRLSVIINGELTRINDLVFQGKTPLGLDPSFADGPADGFLNSLASDVQAAFRGIGAAFEELFGVADDFAGYLAGTFANNVGGSLNNLQLLVQATGKSFDELKNAIINTFLDGRLSFEEALSALQQLHRVMTDGIPDGVGLVTQAFQNLIDAGTKGGRASVDALRDIAFEARELGINSLGALQNHLVQSGQFTAEQVQLLFNALAENGIDSLDELANSSNETAIAILAALQRAGFAFKEPTEQIKDAAEEINNLPDTKKVLLEVDAVYRNGADEAIKILGSPASGAKIANESMGKVLAVAKSGITTVNTELHNAAAASSDAADALRNLAHSFSAALQGSGGGISSPLAKSAGTSLVRNAINAVTVGAGSEAPARAAEEAGRILDAVSATDAYQKLFADFKAGLINREQLETRVNRQIQNYIKLQNQLSAIQEKANRRLAETGEIGGKLARRFEEISSRVENFGNLPGAGEPGGETSLDAMIRKALTGQIDFSSAADLLGGLGAIPGTGDPSSAIEQLLSLGTKGGALSLTALRNIGVQGANSGLANFQDLFLMFERQIGSQAAQSLFGQFNRLGIDSFDKLSNISAEQGISVLGGLQKTGVITAETSDADRDLLTTLRDLPDIKDMTIRLNADVDPELRAIFERLFGEGGYGNSGDAPGRSRERPRRKDRPKKSNGLTRHPRPGRSRGLTA